MKSNYYYSFIGSIFLFIFLLLGFLVYFVPSSLDTFDQMITTFIRLDYPKPNTFFIWYTTLANPTTIIILTLLLACLLFRSNYYVEMSWLLINTIIIAGIANPLLKLLFIRQRPTLLHLVTEHSYSFPSGHSTSSMIVYGTILFILPSLIEQKKYCVLVQLILSGLIFLIGVSRIYLGVHFPSDVIGGFCLGLAWLFLTYPFYLKKRALYLATHNE